MPSPDAIESFARAVLLLAGVPMMVHYSAMAGYLKRAPAVVRFVFLPLIVGLGLFVTGCGLKGYTDAGLIALALATLPLIGLHLTVWASGLHVSEVFEQRARERDLERMHHYVREAANGYEFVSADIVTDSGMQELQEATRRKGVHA